MWYQIAETACIFSTPRPAYVPAKAIKRGDLTRHKLCGAKCCFNDWDRSSRRHHHRRQLFLKNWTDNAISDNNSSLPLHYKQFCRWILFCSKTPPRELFFHSILHRWNILKVGFSYLECFRQLTLFFVTDEDLKRTTRVSNRTWAKKITNDVKQEKWRNCHEEVRSRLHRAVSNGNKKCF